MRKACFFRVMPALVLMMTSVAVCLAQGVDYDSQGKRDPFLNLLNVTKRAEPARVLAPPPLNERPPGLAGLLISEVTLTGTAQTGDSQIVILRGIDDMSYFAKEQSKLFDGYIESVTRDQVVFLREQVDTRGQKRTSKVTKQLQVEDR
jgi:hypothetical protein